MLAAEWSNVPEYLGNISIVRAPNFACIVIACLFHLNRPTPIKRLSSLMGKCLLLCLHTTVARWVGLEVQVLVLTLMEDTTGTTSSAEIAMLIA